MPTASNVSEIGLEVYPPPDKRVRPKAPLAAAKIPARKATGSLFERYSAGVVARVSPEAIRHNVDELTAFHTRHTRSVLIGAVAALVRDRFRQLGYTDIVLHDYVRDNLRLSNVVCTKKGEAISNELLLVCAHYDSRMENLENAVAPAPGADDNASGVAVLLETARVLACEASICDLQFVAFSGEEQGYWGSAAYAEQLKSGGIRLRGLLNLDQIGYPPPDRSITVERDIGNQVADNDVASEEFAQILAQAATNHTTLPVRFGPIYGSDYMPFEARGYVVVGAYANGNNPNYHSTSDVAETLDLDYMAEVTRLVVGSVLHETSPLARLLSVREVALTYLHKVPPLSIRTDIYSGADPQRRTLKEQLRDIIIAGP